MDEKPKYETPPNLKPFETHLKVGQMVTVRRSNGDIEGGWEIRSLEQVSRDGVMKNVVVSKKPTGVPGEFNFRESSLEEIEELNPQ